MFSRNGVENFWLLGTLAIIAFGACTYERPNVDGNIEEPSGVGGANSVSSSSSGLGGQPASSSSSGKGGGPPVSSSSSDVASSSGNPESSSSSGETGSTSSSGSSSSSSSSGTTMNDEGTIHCGNEDCPAQPDAGGCCFMGSGGGTLRCIDKQTMCGGTLFHCDGKEDCPQQVPCCLDGTVASCNPACSGAYICNDNDDCMPGGSCVLTMFGTIGQCEL